MKTYSFLPGAKKLTLQQLRQYRQLLERHYSSMKHKFADEFEAMDEIKKIEEFKRKINETYSMAKQESHFSHEVESIRAEFNEMTNEIEFGQRLYC